MALKTKDRDFRLPKITYLEYKQIEMDRVLTLLFMRLAHDGYPSRLIRQNEITIDAFVDEFLDPKNHNVIINFNRHREIVRRWVETHLMDVVNRGKPDQAIAAPRPLHGKTYLLRNVKQCRDYGASQQIYEMLHGAPKGMGALALRDLRTFFFPDIDSATGNSNVQIEIDVETQALLRLPNKIKSDIPDKTGRDIFLPLLQGAAYLLAEDIVKLFAYRSQVPRTVMVEYLKILICFHLALYHLKLLKVIPHIVQNPNGPFFFDNVEYGDQSIPADWRLAILPDIANERGTVSSIIAERSAETHFSRIPGYIKAHYVIKKLDEFSKSGFIRGMQGDQAIVQHLELLNETFKKIREQFFGQRLATIIDKDEDEEIPSDFQAILELDIEDFKRYIECIYSDRVRIHQGNIVTCFDSLLMKNRPGAMVTQARTRGAKRKFILDTQLLEVLVQLSVLDSSPAGSLYTKELRIDELAQFLRKRYGLYIDELPDIDGFAESPNIIEMKGLRDNMAAFKNRLRDIGFYKDLSDAYVTQNVVPRFTIEADVATENA